MRRDIVAAHRIDARPWADPQAELNGTLSNSLDAIRAGGDLLESEGLAAKGLGKRKPPQPQDERQGNGCQPAQLCPLREHAPDGRRAMHMVKDCLQLEQSQR